MLRYKFSLFHFCTKMHVTHNALTLVQMEREQKAYIFQSHSSLMTLICVFSNMDLDQQVAGGDGTASWLLGVVSDLKLPQPPPIATVPLGTGNNLPFSFGWVRYALQWPYLCEIIDPLVYILA